MQVVITDATWQQIDKDIETASLSSRETVRQYTRKAMERWREQVFRRTESDFIPWFTGYWTQQWLGMKVGWYKLSAKNEKDSVVNRLALYLQEQYHERVLDPVAKVTDPNVIMGDAVTLYLQMLSAHLGEIQEHYAVPQDQFDQRLNRIPAITLAPPPARNASLYQVMQAEPLNTLPAYTALIDKIHKAGGDKGVDSTDTAMAPVAKRASQRMEAEMAPRGAASVVSAAAGKLAGGLITLGVAGIRALIQASDRPDSEALIRSSLGNTFDKAWIKLVQNPTTGVMAGTLYMAGQIEGNLAGSAEIPSVSSGGGAVDWSPPEPTNPQIDPLPPAGE